jgi:hypothetical protein
MDNLQALSARLYAELAVQPSKPGDAELRADRIVYEGISRWRSGLFVHQVLLKEIIAAEIAAAVKAERNRWEPELVSMLEALHRSEMRQTSAAHQMEAGNAVHL